MLSLKPEIMGKLHHLAYWTATVHAQNRPIVMFAKMVVSTQIMPFDPHWTQIWKPLHST